MSVYRSDTGYGCKSWWLVTVKIARDSEEAISALLFEYGSTGTITLAEESDSITLGAYFEDTMNAADLEQALEAQLTRAGFKLATGGLSVSEVPEQDWMEKWKEGFEALRIGERLVIAPSWKVPQDTNGRVVIQIDPGMAFGTGTHETTRLCLEAIERHWHGGSLLDVGTGTGILAIAAALLVPDCRVVGIDIDPQA